MGSITNSPRIPRILYNKSQYEYTDPTEIVNAFANLFMETHEFSHDTCAVKSTSDALPYMLSLISAEEVINIMSTFPNKLMSGYDMIPTFLIKDCRYILAYP